MCRLIIKIHKMIVKYKKKIITIDKYEKYDKIITEK